MKKYAILSGLIVGIIFYGGCELLNNQSSGTGFLEGKITIGPICPVQSENDDPSCQPTEETYKTWQISVWTLNKERKVSQMNPELDGSYRLELNDGTYVVDLDKQQVFGTNDLPAMITIHSRKTTTLNIDIDTGIR